MDPLALVRAFALETSPAALREHAENYARWIDRGGFPVLATFPGEEPLPVSRLSFRGRGKSLRRYVMRTLPGLSPDYVSAIRVESVSFSV